MPSKCYKITLLESANFGVIGSIGGIGHIFKSIPVHLEPEGILSASDIHNF